MNTKTKGRKDLPPMGSFSLKENFGSQASTFGSQASTLARNRRRLGKSGVLAATQVNIYVSLNSTAEKPPAKGRNNF